MCFFYSVFGQEKRERKFKSTTNFSFPFLCFVALAFSSLIRTRTHTRAREREREKERDHEQIFLELDAVDVIRSATFSASWRAEKAERQRSLAQ